VATGTREIFIFIPYHSVTIITVFKERNFNILDILFIIPFQGKKDSKSKHKKRDSSSSSSSSDDEKSKKKKPQKIKDFIDDAVKVHNELR
jgi:hypothetical protein